MGKRLYVGNLPFSANEDEIRTLFEGEGRKVENVSVITDRETGRPRGFAFVEMSSQGDADSAVQKLRKDLSRKGHLALEEPAPFAPPFPKVTLNLLHVERAGMGPAVQRRQYAIEPDPLPFVFCQRAGQGLHVAGNRDGGDVLFLLVVESADLDVKALAFGIDGRSRGA